MAKLRTNHLVPFLAFAAAGLWLTACDSQPKSAPKRAAPVEAATTADEKPKVRDLFNMKSKVLEYAYNPIGKRDPFKEFGGTAKLSQVLDSGGPLTSYEIDQMKLVAVIWGISDPRGMVQLPDGKSYIVKRNTPVGRHFGKVARVTPNSIVIEEEYRGPLGDLQIKESKLPLHSDDDKSGSAMSDEAPTASSNASDEKK